MVSATFGLKPLQRDRRHRHRQADRRRAVPAAEGRDERRAVPVGQAVASAATSTRASSSRTSTSRSAARRRSTRSASTAGRVFAKNEFESIDFQKVALRGRPQPRRRSTARSTTSTTVRLQATSTIDGDYPDLGVWLQRFGLPPIAASAARRRPDHHRTVRSRTRRSTRARRSPACRASTRCGSSDSTFHDGILDVEVLVGGPRRLAARHARASTSRRRCP